MSPETIRSLAAAQGIPLTDEAMAERIAAGAGAAIAVVREALAAGWPGMPGGAGGEGNPLCDYEPGDFLTTLERLAHELPEPPASR